VTLTVPSYVIPGTYGENVAFLSSRPEIQGVELLFYIFDESTRQLLHQELKLLRSYRDRFTYSVHLPDPLEQRHEEIIELTRDLAGSYVLHPPESDLPGFRKLVQRWRSHFGEIFLLENLIGREFHILAADWDGLCLDIGHLLLAGQDLSRFLNSYGPRIREVHLHGLEKETDHRSFGAQEPWLQELLPFLRLFEGTLNLEVFSISQVNTILASLLEVGLIYLDRRWKFAR